MSLRNAGKLVGVVCAVLGLATGAIGCLSDDTSVTPIARDAGAFDASTPVYDAGHPSDDASAPPQDAGLDASIDAAAAHDASAPDSGKVAAVSQAGLVPGGGVGHSAHYTLTGTTGPATAPVLRSPSYQLVGGMSATGHRP